MSDSDKTRGHNLLTKPSEKFIGIKGHTFLLITMAVIFIGKLNLPLVNPFKAVIADRHFMRVPANIFKYLRGPQKGLFGVNHPVLSV